MGGRRKFASASRPPSVWDVDHLRRELENIDVDWRHGEALLTYLAHHPEVTTWADVNWAALKRRVPQKLPAFLEDAFSVRSTRVASRHDSKDGTTTKVVVELRDGAEVEAVVMRHATLRSRALPAACRRKSAARWPARSAPRARWATAAT